MFVSALVPGALIAMYVIANEVPYSGLVVLTVLVGLLALMYWELE